METPRAINNKTVSETDVLIICGNPDNNSLDHALATSYYNGAISTGSKATLIDLGQLKFDPILHQGYKQIQELEPDLVYMQQLIKSAKHLVLVYPSWWGSMPALLKGFFDRAFLPGFAFKYHPNNPMWDKYLKGKTARIILTMDSPGWWNSFIYHRSNIFAVKVATLQYCGIKPVRVTTFSSVRFSTPEKRKKWLQQVEDLGRAGK